MTIGRLHRTAGSFCMFFMGNFKEAGTFSLRDSASRAVGWGGRDVCQAVFVHSDGRLRKDSATKEEMRAGVLPRG
jgi:hypothetical protein